MSSRLRHLRGQRGLTLIEFMMAIMLASVVFMVLYTILNAALDSYAIGRIRSTAVQSGRVTMMRIVNELKYADEIYTCDSENILFSRKEETNGDFQTVYFRFYSGSGEIKRRENGGDEEVMADGIASFSLTYRNAAFGLAGSVDAIRFIEVDMCLQEGGYTVYLRNMVTLENPILVQ